MDDITELIYLDQGTNKIVLSLNAYSELPAKIECYDKDFNRLISTKIIPPYSRDLKVTFDGLDEPGYYNFILYIDEEKKYYEFYVHNYSIEDLVSKEDTKKFIEKYKRYYSNKYLLNDIIFALSTSVNKTATNCISLDRIINVYNALSRLQNKSPIVISKRNSILQLENTDLNNEYNVDIISENDKLHYLTFDQNGLIILDLPKGLYKIYVSQDIATVQEYLFESFGDEIDKLIYDEKQKDMDLNIPSDIEDFKDIEFGYNGTEEDHKILAAIDFYNILNPLLPIPKLKYSEDELKISFGSESEKEIFNKVKNLIDIGQDIYIYFSEEDSLIDNPDYTSYRRVRLVANDNKKYNIFDDYTDEYSGYLTRNIKFDLNFNNERYYYWLGTETNIRLSDTGTINLGEEDDEIDYNQVYAKIKLKRNMSNYLVASDYSDLAKSALNLLFTYDDLPYEDFTVIYQRHLLSSVNNDSKYMELIKCIEGSRTKSSKKFDHKVIEKITVKYNYKEVNLTLNDDFEKYIIIYKKYNLRQSDIQTTFLNFEEKTVNISALKDSIVTIKLINTEDFTVSRYIMIYNYDLHKTMNVYTNGLEKENIYGL